MEKRNTQIILIVTLVVIILSGAAYLYHRSRLNTAVSELEITFDSVNVRSLQLLPSPEANLTLIYVANNTQNIDFRITLDGELYYGSNFITPLTVENARIRGNGLSTFQMDVTITGSILNTIDPENRSEYILQGELVATSRFLGIIPVTVTKSLSNYDPGQN